MVSLNLVKSENTALVQKQPLVAVFIGGTSGVGRNTIISLTTTHGSNGKGLRAYIIGRNAKAAEEIITQCQTLCPSGQFIFIQASNLALLAEVDVVCAELLKREEKEASVSGGTARIDILVMTQAIFKPWDARNETTEGLDTFMSLLSYSRIRFITLLLPLLLSSPLPAHIISVFGPGRDTTLIEDDFSLRSPTNYGFMSSGSHAAYLTTFYFEHLATLHPEKLSLSHYFPGLVIHDGFQDPTFPWWFRGIFKYLGPLFRLAPSTLSNEESGARTLFCASSRFSAQGGGDRDEGGVGVAESSDGVRGGGAYRVNWDGEVVAVGKQYGRLRGEGWGEKMVGHTGEVFGVVEKGERYMG